MVALAQCALDHAFAAGDVILKTIAERLQAVVRPRDHAGRFGGDEFCLLLPGILKARDAGGQLQRITQAVSQPYCYREQVIQSSMSIGLALFPLDSQDAGELLKAADSAMYQAKRSGKNCLRVANETYFA